MFKTPCKECPWIIRNKFNDMIIEHSKKYDREHNCHMIPQEKRGSLWDVKEETKCAGRKKYEKEKC